MARLFKIRSSDDWHGKIRLGPYRQKRARFCADKDTSKTWMALLQAAVDRAQAGEPPKPETLKELPRRMLESFGLVSQLAAKRRGGYGENVDDYVAELKTAGRDTKYIRNCGMYLRAVGDACGWHRLRDVERDSFVDYLEGRKANDTAPRTLKNIIATVSAFCFWAVEAKRLDANPIERVMRIDQRSDRRRQRRAFTPDEVRRLLAVAGPRELVYRVALGTGLRRRELKQLEWRDVRVDNTLHPHLALRAEATKSKRADTLPLRPDLVARLLEARPDVAAGPSAVFSRVPAFDTWQRDLERAGIAYRGEDGRILGFHSLRVTFCSELERAGVSPRTIMELMRHRDYKLTAGTYTDVRVIDTFGAVGKLPEYSGTPEPEPQTARKTGTDDAPVGPVGRQDQIRHQKACSGSQKRALSCTTSGTAESQKTLENTGKTGGLVQLEQTPRT